MISTTAQYALRAVVFLATLSSERSSESSSDIGGEFAGRIAIAEATLVPVDYLLKVLGELDAAGIVESKRGPGGGYRLTAEPAAISALDVVLAVDKIPRITKCPLGFANHTQLCPLHQLLDDASRKVEEAFAETTIDNLIPQHKRKTGQRKKPKTCEFPLRKA
jgi:Rrf2 family protein